MRAVPRFDMAPGERLTPIREVKSAILARRTEAAQARPEPNGPVLAAEDLCKTFTLRAGWFSGRTRTIHAVNGVSLQLAARQDARARRRIRLRQDHRVEDHHARAARPIRGTVTVRRRRGAARRVRARGRRAQGLPAGGAVRVPGPVLVAQPAHDGVRDPHRAAAHPRHRHVRRALRAGKAAPRDGRPRPALAAALPALLLGRAAAAARHRAGAGARAARPPLRRAGLGARRLGPGADPQPAEGPAERRSACPTCSCRTTSRSSTTSPTRSP